MSKDDQGWVIVYTGDGKGKTTAALGLCLRALGHGNKCLVIQFIKGDWTYGELEGCKRLGSQLEIRPMGAGCIGILGDNKPRDEHRRVAGEAFRAAQQAVLSGEYEVVVLDEIHIATHYELISVDDVMTLIETRPRHVNLVLTGRYADQKVIESADLVTDMKEIKHPYRRGITSKKGIDY